MKIAYNNRIIIKFKRRDIYVNFRKGNRIITENAREQIRSGI